MSSILLMIWATGSDLVLKTPDLAADLMVVFVEVDVDGGEVALTGGWRYLPDKDDDNGEILMAVVRWMKIMAVLDLWW
ncbi:hypothetical protein QVD17_01417 [Tagetes erecta]|uniref:Uncharacterized protein n=1 Tax=Tagetes erecta TaxID=13708 RepID=A0AAD8LAK0_TARER|nr:hypothetical protein QVD17_01417 [Tagetes erecta]